MDTEPEDVPFEAGARLRSGTFTSGLTAPDFAAALQMGLTPVGFVQGFCVMQWSWYYAGSPYMRGVGPYAGRSGAGYQETFQCPHGFVSMEHRSWGQNYEQPWIESAWQEGFGTAYRRMVEEAEEAGAHGVIGVVDEARHLGDLGVIEFHLTGTAVTERERKPGAQGVWTTYLAGQRLAKLEEAGFAPVSVAAAISSVRVWAYCVTEYLLSGRGTYAGYSGFAGSSGGGVAGQEIDQLSRAHTAARRVAREHVRAQIGGDFLHGAVMSVHERHVGAEDEEVTCTLKGTRVRRVGEFKRLEPPRPTVVLD